VVAIPRIGAPPPRRPSQRRASALDGKLICLAIIGRRQGLGPNFAQGERVNIMPEENKGTPVSAEKDVSARPKTEFERKLGMASTIVQILAILVGGVFAITKFGLLDTPTLQTNLRVGGQLNWLQHRGSYCIADLNIEVTNLSKSSIDVTEVRGSAWFISEPPDPQKPIRYLDLVELSKQAQPEEEFHYASGPLVGNYPPGQAHQHTFEWSVERRKGAYVFFKIEANGTKGPLEHQYQWDWVCGIQPVDQKAKEADK